MTLAPLLLLLVLPTRSLSLVDVTSVDSTTTVTVYPWNASRIDLSNRGLTGRLILAFHPDPSTTAASTTATTAPSTSGSSPRWRQAMIDILNLSGNPRLAGFSIDVTTGSNFDAVHVNQLDIGGTRMAPIPGRLFHPMQTPSPTPLISIRILTANGTEFAEPLDLSQATDYMYNLRVESFSLAGWKLINESRLPANLTSHRANSCASKRFHSLYVTQMHSKDGVELVGVAGASSLLAVSETIDFSSNRLKTLANVTFSAGRVDLSNNRIIEMPNVAFRPGSVCGAAVTGPPTLLLRRNQLGSRALNNLAGQQFSGLDLAENPGLLESSTIESPIYVSEFLDLSGLWGRETQLSSLLTHIRHFDGSSFGLIRRRFRLSLADNWLPDLSSVAELVGEFLRNGDGNLSLHVDVSGNPRLVHLNLSDLPATAVASLTARRLPHLHSASVQVDGDAAAAAMERLRRRGQRPDISDLIALWSHHGSTLRLDAQPSDCCLRADASELVCSFEGHSAAAGRGPRSRRGSVFCYGDGAGESVDGYGYGYGRLPHPPELPLLFSCVVLGGALLLGLVTGIAFFYARRRSRGRYAVYSVYDMQKLKSQHQQQQPHQLASVCVNRGFGRSTLGKPVLLKAVSVVHLPLESALPSNTTHL